VSREIDEDATAVGFALREFAQLGNDVRFSRLLVEKLGDVCGRDTHRSGDFARAVHVIWHAEEWRDFFVLVNRYAHDQGMPEGIGLRGSGSSRPNNCGQQDEYQVTESSGHRNLPPTPSFRRCQQQSSPQLGICQEANS
jgi:hypothetical protein